MLVTMLQLNFTTNSGETFPEYRNVHSGLAHPQTNYGLGGEFSIGWVGGGGSDRNRNLPASPDERYDSFVFTTTPTRTFRITTPRAALYSLRMIGGDVQFVQGTWWTLASTGVAQWLDVTKTLTAQVLDIIVGGPGTTGASILNWLDLKEDVTPLSADEILRFWRIDLLRERRKITTASALQIEYNDLARRAYLTGQDLGSKPRETDSNKYFPEMNRGYRGDRGTGR